jgi:histidinol phosphatase-like enzyme (inositol monophosphatase family)
MLSSQDIDELATFALELADAAAEVTLPYFRAGLDVDHKSGKYAFDPVTAADREGEAAIRKLITTRYPEHGIFGEEHGKHTGSSGLTWVLDPIDGTRSFICGVPLWGTLIALNDGTRPVIGVMDQPYIGERFVGRPSGTTLIGPRGTVPLKTSNCIRLADAKLGNTDAGMFINPVEKEAFREISSKVRLRRFGGDCYFYAGTHPDHRKCRRHRHKLDGRRSAGRRPCGGSRNARTSCRSSGTSLCCHRLISRKRRQPPAMNSSNVFQKIARYSSHSINISCRASGTETSRAFGICSTARASASGATSASRPASKISMGV